MSGFSPNMMASLLSANTAMTAAKTSQNTITNMRAQKETLQAEIKSGYGDVEGKQKEVERLDMQMEKASAMQQSALNEASSQIGTALTPTDESDAAKNTEKNNDKTASDKAKDKAADVKDKVKDTDVAAVDYEKGMHTESDGKTSVAISPEFLEKMADSPELDAEYTKHIETMRALDSEQRPAQVTSQRWAVDKNGSIHQHAVVSAATSTEEILQLHASMQQTASEAFGAAFGSVTISREDAPAAAPSLQAAGLLIDTSM